MVRRINPRRVKIHRSYTYGEVARLIGRHKNTVARWVDEEGLPALKECRPFLILGRDLRSFLESQNGKSKRPLRTGKFYCLRCRDAKKPAEGMVEFRCDSPGALNAQALCPDCAGLMNRRVSREDVDQFKATGPAL